MTVEEKKFGFGTSYLWYKYEGKLHSNSRELESGTLVSEKKSWETKAKSYSLDIIWTPAPVEAPLKILLY